MPYRYDTQHLNGQQRAIIDARDREDELRRKASQENKVKIEAAYKLTEEQLNFLARLKLEGSQHYDIFGDRIGDEEAEKQLEEMSKEGYVTYLGGDATITKKGLEQVNDRTIYFK
jgi:hypothetical protein